MLIATDTKTNYLPYAGIGSRLTPSKLLPVIRELAIKLEKLGFTLRSGGARGADSFFADKVTNKEIYLPWFGFNQVNSIYIEPALAAYELASKYHPAFNKLSNVVKHLMARNSHQVLGQDLKTPALFLVCWTKDGCESASRRDRNTGGTGQAISIASDHGIMVFNLRNKGRLEEVLEYAEFLVNKQIS